MNFINIYCVDCHKTLGKIKGILYNAVSDLDFYCVNCGKEIEK